MELEKLRESLKREPEEFIAWCDEEYRTSVRCAAMAVAVSRSPAVLLAGPSGSGKTTTSMLLEKTLGNMGIRCHHVSMDDYFLDVSPETTPRTPEGDYDFESFGCVDGELLRKHFDDVEAGRPIDVPKFNFALHKRDGIRTHLVPGKGDIVIFEGIHAFNPMIIGRHEAAVKMIASPMTGLTLNGEEYISPRDTRLIRRIVRDAHYRGNPAAETLSIWRNVVRAEDSVLSRQWEGAHIRIDTSIPYEYGVFAASAPEILGAVTAENKFYREAEDLERRLSSVPRLDEKEVPPDSLVREFIGGGVYEY